jgi:cobalamin biosynthesis protein CobD/CbiB
VDTARIHAEASVLACQQLRDHLNRVRALAVRGDIPAARRAADDVVSDLDEIQRLRDEGAVIADAEAAVAAKLEEL